jgi:hypothetical protein
MDGNIQITQEQLLAKIGELTMVAQAQTYAINKQAERIRELEHNIAQPNVSKKEK